MPGSSTPDLPALEHANFIRAIALAASSAPDALVRQEDGVALLSTGIPLRLFNQVLIEDDGAGEAAVVAAVTSAVGLLRERDAPFVVNLRRGTDDRLVPLMAWLGLAPITPEPWMPGLAWHPIAPGSTAGSVDGPASRVGAELESGIEAVRDAAGIEAHIQVAAEGFGMPEEMLRPVIGPALIADRDATLYVGRVDGRPVTSGLGVRSGRTIGVYDIATVPDVRGRGFAAAMTSRIVRDGVAAGCDVAVLQSSAMGLSLYRRLGFETVVEYVGYIPPEEPQRGPSAGD